jgi:hypothetical protein
VFVGGGTCAFASLLCFDEACYQISSQA